MKWLWIAVVAALASRGTAIDCSLVSGYDRFGGDIQPLGAGFRNASSPQECCSLCNATVNCQYFSYAPHSSVVGEFPPHNCWLKSSAGVLQPNPRRTSSGHGPNEANPCKGLDVATHKWCDLTLGVPERVQAAIDAMNITEKLQQISTYTPAVQPAIPRLNWPAYSYHSEGLHGLRRTSNINKFSTVFPQTTALASTFNMSVIRSMAQVRVHIKHGCWCTIVDLAHR